MRYAKLVFMLLVPAIALMAADPFVGTWKLNPAKSKFKAGAPYQELTLTISELGSDRDVALKGTAANGAPLFVHYTIPANGGTGKIIEGPYDAVSGKSLNARMRAVSYTKGGKVLYTAHSKVSTDGKTLAIATKGTNSAGQTVDALTVYDKQ
jgi:hypothetical protein